MFADTGIIENALFESPGLGVFVFAIAWVAMRVVGRRTDNKRLMHASWVPLGVVVALVATSSLVTTQREQLAKTQTELMLVVEEKDFARFREIVAPETMTLILGQELDRDRVEARIGKADIEDLKVTRSTAHFHSPDNADTMINIRADGSVGDFPGINISQWAIRWRYVDGQWQAYRFECVAIGAEAVFNNN